MGITSRQRGKQIGPGFASWTPVPFNPADFTATSGMTWAVTAVGTNEYCQIGNLVIWNIFVTTSTLSGTPRNSLNIKPPFVPKHSIGTAGSMQHNNDWEVALCSVSKDWMASILRQPLTNFIVGAANFQVQFSLAYKIG